MRRFLVLVVCLILGLYVVAVGALFVVQRQLLFPGSHRIASVAEAGLAGFQDLVLQTPDGERLSAWWKPPAPGKALIVYFHGNGGSLWDRRFRARALTQSG